MLSIMEEYSMNEVTKEWIAKTEGDFAAALDVCTRMREQLRLLLEIDQ